MKHKLKEFDPAEYLENENMMAGYLSDAQETRDTAFIADALDVVARARMRRYGNTDEPIR